MEKKKIYIIAGIILGVILLSICLVLCLKGGKKKEETKQEQPQEEVKKEEIHIIDINSKTRPLAVSVNNTPVAVKVQQGLNNAYIVYELPLEGEASRLLALFKDVDTKVGTIRSLRHNFIDYAYESDAILVGWGWSHYAEDQLKNKVIDYIQGMNGQGSMKRENPEKLATEHTVNMWTDKVMSYAIEKKKYKKESDNTNLLHYRGIEIELKDKENAKKADSVKLPYGDITTEFKYNSDTKMYVRWVNGKLTKDYKTKEEFTTKNIIIQKISYKLCDDNNYLDLKTTGSGDGYYITNGYSTPIKWSKENRKAKTKYTYLDGTEIEVNDGRTYIEIHSKSKKVTIK